MFFAQRGEESMKLEELYEINKNDEVFIHLADAASKDGISADLLWEGWIKDIPSEYMSSEVIQTGQSLKDSENGINGHYVYIEVERTLV